MTEKNSVVKKRNWAFVCYPESMPKNWLEILQETGSPIAISPLHDKDKDPDEKEKKAHYHVIICYGGPTSFNVVKKLTNKLNSPVPIALEQVRGYYRYLTHKDNPEKYQYDEKDIKCLNGFNIRDFVELTKNETIKIIIEIRKIIRENGIIEYSDLMDYLDAKGNFDYISVATYNTIHFNAYLKSFRYKENN